MIELPPAFRAVAETFRVADPDGQWERLVSRTKGGAPNEKQWIGWIRNAPKLEDLAAPEEETPRARRSATADATGKNREPGKPWRYPHPRIDLDTRGPEDLEAVRELREVLGLVSTVELTGEKIAELRKLAPADARRALLELGAFVPVEEEAAEVRALTMIDPICSWCGRICSLGDTVCVTCKGKGRT